MRGRRGRHGDSPRRRRRGGRRGGGAARRRQQSRSSKRCWPALRERSRRMRAVHLRVHNHVPLFQRAGQQRDGDRRRALAANALRREKLSPERADRVGDGASKGIPTTSPRRSLAVWSSRVVENDGPVKSISVALPEELWVCVAVPDFYLNTRYSRARLPERVTRARRGLQPFPGGLVGRGDGGRATWQP